MLRPPEGTDRERILAIGSFGTGKTKAWLDIAWWSQKTKSTSQFYVLDTDAAVRRMLSGTKYGDLVNVHLYEVFEWEEYKRALADIISKATPEDWTIIDFIGTSWEAVVEWYIDEVFAQDYDEYFMTVRKGMKTTGSGKDTGGLKGWEDWQFINKSHRKFMNDLVHKCPTHKFFTAVAVPIGESADKALKATFGAFGVKPKGQKHLAHQVHTALLLQTMRAGEWYLNSIKDRERELHEGTELKDFVRDYLMPTAGWML